MPTSETFASLSWLIAQLEGARPMGINEKFPPQLLPLSVNPASGRARASLLRSMCPISGFPTAHRNAGPICVQRRCSLRVPAAAAPRPRSLAAPLPRTPPSDHHRRTCPYAAWPLHHRASNPPRRRTARHLLEVSAPIRAGQRAPARVAIASIRPIMFGATGYTHNSGCGHPSLPTHRANSYRGPA